MSADPAAAASPDVAVPPGAESPKRLNLSKVVWIMVLAIICYCAYAVYSGLGKLGQSLATYQWWTFGAACSLAFGNYLLRIVKWEFYLTRLGIRGGENPAAPGLRGFESALTFLSGFVFTVTPGKVGEVFKSLVLHETHQVPFARTAPIVIAERITDVLGIVVLIAIGSTAFAGGLFWAAVGLGLVVTLLLFISSRTLSLGIIDRLAQMPGKLGAIAPKLHDAYESLSVLVSPKNLILPTIISIMAWMLECLSLWIILRGFGQTTPVPLAMFFYATSTLAGAIVPVPGGLGVTEGALRSQLTELGHVSAGASTASMILVRFATLWFAVLVGFIALSILKRRRPGLLAN